MKPMLRVLSLIAVCLVISHTGFSETSAQENLVMNGDFEEVFNNQPVFWSLDAWHMEAGNTKVYSESAGAQSGKYFVTIENMRSNDSRLVQDLLVKPSTSYLLSAFVKVDMKIEARVGASIGIVQAGLFEPVHSEDTKGKWENLEYAFKTAPDQTRIKIGIRLGHFGSDTIGKASFDNVRLVEVKDASGVAVVPLQNSKVTAAGVEQSSPFGFILLYCIAGIIVILAIAFLVRSSLLDRKDKKLGQIDKPDTREPSTQLSGGQQAATLSTPAALEPLRLGKESARFTKADVILVAIMTIAYSVIAFTHLGVMEAPVTYWQPSSRGESVTVDFGKEQTVKRIYFWEGLPAGHNPNESKYEVEGSLDGVTWEHLALLNPKTIYWWYYENTDKRIRYARLTADVPGSWLNEVVFFGEDTTAPLEIEKVTPGTRQPFTVGKVENLFDEYSNVGNVAPRKQFVYRPQVMTGMQPQFDEQYHVRTAIEHLNFRNPFENTHPPLAKLLIAGSMIVFGINPFGWRFMGTLFGVLIVPLMFAFGKRLFKKTEYAFIAAFLMMFDFMHFTQSRLATIDTYPVFFIILTFYFMHRFRETSYLSNDFRKLMVPLLLSGIAWGLGAATKWTAVYAWFGLAIVFFVGLYGKAKEVRDAELTGDYKKNKSDKGLVKARIDEFPKRAWQLVGWAAVSFVIVPLAIYAFAYFPLLLGNDLLFNIGWIVENNIGMYRYHAELQATHPSTSAPWQWPLMIKPIPYYYGEGLPNGQMERIVGFGNPAVWWVGTLSVIVLSLFALVSFVRRIATAGLRDAGEKAGAFLGAIFGNSRFADSVRFLILVGFATVYVPWLVSPRQIIFIYHFFPSVPFVILAVVYLIKLLREKAIEPLRGKSGSYALFSALGNGLVYLYLAIALILFIVFYPVISGVTVASDYVAWLRWLPTWSF